MGVSLSVLLHREFERLAGLEERLEARQQRRPTVANRFVDQTSVLEAVVQNGETHHATRLFDVEGHPGARFAEELQALLLRVSVRAGPLGGEGVPRVGEA